MGRMKPSVKTYNTQNFSRDNEHVRSVIDGCSN